MKTPESFQSANQERLKPVGLDECAALNGGFVIVRDPLPVLACPIGHCPIRHGPAHPVPGPVPVIPPLNPLRLAKNRSPL
jgi:hypothetical protein